MLRSEHLRLQDERFMRRCFTLARMGRPLVKTNPLVGCCIVYDNRIIGEGYHHEFGHDHAEIDTIKSVHESDRQYLTQSVIYVSLAPCNHQGKTPACSSEIIALGIPRVVIAIKEINALASGGIVKLRKAGVEVTTGVLEEEARMLISSFDIGVHRQRPFITLKWAQSSDGFIGKANQEIAISSKQSQLKVHDLRRQNNAILIGGGTAITDDPALTTRRIPGPNPLRVVIAGQREIPARSILMSDELETVIFTTQTYSYQPVSKQKKIIQLDKIDLQTIVSLLFTDFQVGWLLIEGGASVLHQFLAADLWDVCWRITATEQLEDGIKAPLLAIQPMDSFTFGTDEFEIFRNEITGSS